MRLFVLAGGIGSRLKTAVSDVPKALAPIGDKPFLQLQIENWLSQGVCEFTFLLHYQADQIIDFLVMQKSLFPTDCRIDWVIEPQPLDTGGAVAHVVKTLNVKENFLLTNGDTCLGGGLQEVFQTAAPAMAVVYLDNVGRYGQVQFNEDQLVTSFTEKDDQDSSGWINAGLCHLDPVLLETWAGQPFSLERGLFPKLLKKQQLTAVPLQTPFIDIGIPEDYYRFCRWIESGKQDFL